MFKRLSSLERKFTGDAELKAEYTRVSEDYFKLKHVSLVENPDNDGYYFTTRRLKILVVLPVFE